MLRKLFIILGIIATCVLVFILYQRSNSVTALMDRFAGMPDGPEKLELSTRIHFASDFEPKIESNYLADALRIQPVMEYLTSKTKAFEASLSEEAKTEIVKDVKPSRVPPATFSFDTSMACTEEQYKSIENEIGLETLARRGVNMALLAGMYEDRLRPAYFRSISNYIHKNGCSVGSCKELAAWYLGASKRIDTDQVKLKNQIQKLELDLKSTGFDLDQAENLLQSYAQKWPACMGQLNLQFGTFISTSATHARGKYLLSEYKRLEVKNEADLEHKKPTFDAANPLKESALDGWGYEYTIEVSSSGELKLVSGGSDNQVGTEDDISIE